MRTLLAALVAAALTLHSNVAGAQDAPAQPDAQALEKAKAHFAKGRELYDSGDKAGAVEEFKEAYKLTRNALLLYNIGLVYDEIHDKPLAVHYYEKFLKDAPDNDATKENRSLATDRVKTLKKEIAAEEAAAAEEAKKVAAEEARKKKAADAEAKKSRRNSGVTEFTHALIEEAPPGRPIDVTAEVPVDEDWSLVLYYRASGDSAFQATRMRPRYTEMVGRIPAEAVSGSSVQYYIEVKDSTGKLVTTSGRANSPNIIFLDAGAKPHYYADLGEGSGSMVGDDDDLDLGGGGGPTGPVDDKADWETYARWGTTAGAAAFLTTSIIFYVVASSQSSELEAEAFNSQNPAGGRCSNGSDPPCTAFSDYQKDLESAGKTYETLTNVTLVLGVLSAGAAGYFWYRELSAKEKAPEGDRAADAEAKSKIRIGGAPIIGKDFVGAGAIVQF